MNVTRIDYPRPQFEREQWVNLNGEWEFEFDDNLIGEQEKWYVAHEFSRKIQVPFAFQSQLSGIADPGFHDTVWYRKSITIPDYHDKKRTILHFGAVDYAASVWVNGQLATFHEGGHTPFSVDITDHIHEGIASIVVRAQDYSTDISLPRGKQYWKEHSESIFYTRTTGIWQTVWLEAVYPVHINKAKFTPDIDSDEIRMQVFFSRQDTVHTYNLVTKITFNGQFISEDSRTVTQPEEFITIKLHDFPEHNSGNLWSPEKPNLYDVEFNLYANDVEVDKATSYFGMRKISVVDGQLCLNNRPYYTKMVLDQGYFPEGNLTPPTDEAIKQDVVLTKAMGFNGARKHQKIEDPRYHYWCDKLGLLVWGEMANAYAYSNEYVRRITMEWQEAIERDYNHPCIVAWVPLNESWGVPNILNDKYQQQHALTMYHLTKSLDDTRLVISNDGWEHVKSDICTIHDYEHRRDVLEKRYSSSQQAIESRPANRWIYVPGFQYEGAPIHISEYGGISYQKSDREGWGYSAAHNDKDFLERYMAVTQPLLQSPIVQGFCYTQLTDVEQEINGLLTYDRQPKVQLELIKQINEGATPDLSLL